MLDFTKPMKLENSGRRVKWICDDIVEICGNDDCRCNGNPKIPCGARQCVDKETGIIYSGLYNGVLVINTPRPGRPPSGLTPHPVKLYCSDEQWAAYNDDRSARGMTWGEYIEHLKYRSDKIEALADTLPAQTA